MSERAHFRGVIYNRTGSPNIPEGYHTYLVGGLLVTKEPLEGMEDLQEVVVDGMGDVVLEACHLLPKLVPEEPLGTVDHALLNLSWLVPEP